MKQSKSELCKFKPNLKMSLIVNIKNLIEVNYQLFFKMFKTFVYKTILYCISVTLLLHLIKYNGT